MSSLCLIFLEENIIWWILRIQIRQGTWLLIQGRLFRITCQNSEVDADAAIGRKIFKKSLNIVIHLYIFT